MPLTIGINGLSLVHETSNGVASATAPDVCLTPSPTGPVPVPYPNVALSSTLAKGTKRVLVDGGSSAAIDGSEFSQSMGDEAGTAGGVASGVNMAPATWLSFSTDVMLEGKPACRLTDKMLMNKGNTVCSAGEQQAPVVGAALQATVRARVAAKPKRKVDRWQELLAKAEELLGLLEGGDKEKAEACIERLRRYGNVGVYAAAANDSYNDITEGYKPPIGLQRLTAVSPMPDHLTPYQIDNTRQLLSNIDAWSDDETGLDAALYYREETKEFILAFQGTGRKMNAVPDCIDMKAAVDAARGHLPAQYIQGKELADTLTGIVGPIVVTGHSLGGGIGSFTSMANEQVRAYAFNPASFSDEILKKAGGSVGDDRVESFIVDDELLDEGQKFFRLTGARGRVSHLEPVPKTNNDLASTLLKLGAGTLAASLSGDSGAGVAISELTGMAFESFRRHLGDYVTRGIEEQMKDDIACIESFLYPLSDY